MPESASEEAAIATDVKGINPEKSPKTFPHSILKEPKIGIVEDSQSATTKTADERTPAPGPSFDPIVSEGETTSPCTKAENDETETLT